MRIDADAHVDETEATWDWLEESGSRFRTITVEADESVTLRGGDKAWKVGDVMLRRPVRDYRRTGTSDETNQLLDVNARLKHLDELRIDMQVIYPTTFIRMSFIGNEELEVALTRSYNRWIASRTAESGGRLRWIAELPFLTMDEAVDELRWAREHGARPRPHPSSGRAARRWMRPW